MEDFFYSPSEEIAFHVAGYTENPCSVEKIVAVFTEEAKKFAQEIGVDVTTVNIQFVTSSSKYNSMHVFYAKGVQTKPEGAFEISSKNGWTMQTWLQK
jgi:hypothetical protein